MNSIQVLQTQRDETLALLGERPTEPAPTLVVLGADARTNLTAPSIIESGALLREQHGFLCVSVDSPCEGDDRRPGEPECLGGWRARLDKGDDLVGDFNQRMRSVLDHLAATRVADPRRLAFVGVSRGGFLALHYAASDPRVRCVAAISPVTDLRTLKEFAGLEDDARMESLALIHRADDLAGRPVWIIIGDRDDRVGTGHAVTLARQFSQRAVDRGLLPQVFLHVLPAEGHTQPAESHRLAAAWIAALFTEGGGDT